MRRKIRNPASPGEQPDVGGRKNGWDEHNRGEYWVNWWLGGEDGENAEEQLMRLTREEAEWNSETWERGRWASERDHREREEARKKWETGGWDNYDSVSYTHLTLPTKRIV